jgi:prepilin-type N-terminal cleavage/methylation domain-containing protein
MQRGFTLIELMIVLAIIGILAAVVAPMIAGRGQSTHVEPPSGATTVHSVSCVNGILMQNGEPFVRSGDAVKC